MTGPNPQVDALAGFWEWWAIHDDPPLADVFLAGWNAARAASDAETRARAALVEDVLKHAPWARDLIRRRPTHRGEAVPALTHRPHPFLREVSFGYAVRQRGPVTW